MKRILLFICVIIITATTLFFTSLNQEDPWKVPERYEILKNPVPPDEASIAAGEEFYNYFCISCHGSNGKGLGNKAIKLDKSPTDFTSEIFQKQSDGALLYKTYSGHREMPPFKMRLLPGNRDAMDGTFGKTRIPGDLVNYLRSFGTKKQHP